MTELEEIANEYEKLNKEKARIAQAEFVSMVKRIAELENIVEAYAAHTPDCEILNYEPNDEADTTTPKCTCGYKAATVGYFEKYAVEDDDYNYSTQKNFD